jgi:hypothetical protein
VQRRGIDDAVRHGKFVNDTEFRGFERQGFIKWNDGPSEGIGKDPVRQGGSIPTEEALEFGRGAQPVEAVFPL